MSRDFRAGMLVGVVIAILFICAIGRFASVFAHDWAIATVGSQHLGGGDFCEKNPGFGIESGEEWRNLLGVYRNSLREDDRGCRTWSLYAGKSWLPIQSANWRLGGAAMGIIGYESAVTLGVAMVIAYEEKKWGANLIWFPDKKGDLLQGVIGVQLKRTF